MDNILIIAIANIEYAQYLLKKTMKINQQVSERKYELRFLFERAALAKVTREAKARVGGKKIHKVMRLNQKKSSHVMQTLLIIKSRLPLVN